MIMAIKRGFVVLIGLSLQILLFLFTYLYLGDHVTVLNFLYKMIGLLIVLWLIKNSKSYAYSLPWIVIILLFPLVGTLLYLILGYNKRTSRTLKRIKASENRSRKYLVQDEKVRKKIDNKSRIKYITDYTNYPVSSNNDVTYYELGELAYKEMLKELKKAKKFIFFEYFIIAKGKMWDSILEI